MQKIFFILLLFYPIDCVLAQAGNDPNLFNINRIQQWYNNKQFDSICYHFNADIQSKVKPEQMQQTFANIYEQTGRLKSADFLKFSNDQSIYKGYFDKATLSILFATDSAQKIKTLRFIPFIEDTKDSNFKLNLKTATIHGELTFPKSKTGLAVVIIVPGSGPTDRDGNSNLGLKTDTYKKIAEHLQAEGIACLRYDKRGVGSSVAPPQSIPDLTLGDYVTDLCEVIRNIKKDTIFKAVYIAGHSEGALIGMLAAKQQAVNGFISIAGAADPIDKILTQQINPTSKDKALLLQQILKNIKLGEKFEIKDDTLKSMFPLESQVFLASWMKYNPSKIISELKIPTLILQGDNDIQISVEQGKRLHAANPKSKLVVLKKMNHILKVCEYDRLINLSTYQNPSLPVSTELLTELVTFISSKRYE